MKNGKVVLIILIMLSLVFFSCSKDSTGPGHKNPTENWDINIDDGAGVGSWELELMPDSTIISRGSWVVDYGKKAEISCNFISSPIVFVGQEFSFTANGTAHHSGINQDSEFTITVSGSMYNGVGSGEYEIDFAQSGWESENGVWSGTLNNGEGVTPTMTALKINVLLQPFLDYNFNVDQVFIRITRANYTDSTNAIITDSIATAQFVNIDAGVYGIYYEIFVDNILTVSEITDGVVDPNKTNIINIREYGIPPNFSINFGEGFDFPGDIEYPVLGVGYDSDFNFVINANIIDYGSIITNVEYIGKSENSDL